MCRISSRARGSRAPEGRRNELTGLIAAEGACPVRLDVLTEPEAQQLLAGRLGAGRVAAEAAAYRGDRTVRASPAGPGDRGCSGGYPPDVDWARSQQVALAAAARRLGDDAAQALALRSLGEALTRLGSWQDARSHLLNSLTMYANLRDDTGQASCHYGMALLSGSQGDHARALYHAQHALRLYRAAGDLAGQAFALNAVGGPAGGKPGRHQAQHARHRLPFACRQPGIGLQLTGLAPRAPQAPGCSRLDTPLEAGQRGSRVIMP